MDFKEYIQIYSQRNNVYWTGEIPWRIYKGILMPLTLPHMEFNFNSEDIKKLIKSTKTKLAIWTYGFDTEESGWWWLIKEKPYSLSSLKPKSRYNIRHGLRKCEVKPVSAQEIAETGFSCYKEAMKRHTQTNPMNEKTFKERMPWYDEDKSYEIWGVFYEKNLVGYGVYRIVDNVVFQEDAIFDPNYFRYHSSYALIHTITDFYLNEKEMKYITPGMRSISHETGFQDFVIENFQYRKAYCKLGLESSNIMNVAINLIYYLYPVWKNLLMPANLKHKLNILYKLKKSVERVLNKQGL